MNQVEYTLPSGTKVTVTPELNKEQSEDFMWHLQVKRAKGIRRKQKMTLSREEISAMVLLYASYLPLEALDELRDAVKESHDRIDDPTQEPSE